jgi:hypothetical protein
MPSQPNEQSRSRRHACVLANFPQRNAIHRYALADQVDKSSVVRVPLTPRRSSSSRRGSFVVIIAPNLLFRQLRTHALMRKDISDDGLRSLVDMDMLHSDVLVTTVT